MSDLFDSPAKSDHVRPGDKHGATILGDVSPQDRITIQVGLAERLLEQIPLPKEPSLMYSLTEGGETIVVPIHNELTVGRLEGSAQVVVPVPKMSGLHFKIMRSEEGFTVSDERPSTNGTYINGRPWMERRFPLENGDCIEAGGVKFVFMEGSDEAASSPGGCQTTGSK
jgi:hypothetical protein